MDDTLIKTVSDGTFSLGIYDMTLRLDVFAKIKMLAPNAVFIVSNQGGIEAGYVNPTLFQHKFMYVLAALQGFLGLHTFVAGRFCPTQNPKFEGRKPNTAMLTIMLDEFEQIVKDYRFSKEECVYIGDTLIDTERRTAENFGCDFVPVEDFLRMHIDPPTYRIVSKKDCSDYDGRVISKAEAVQIVREHTNENGETEWDIVPSKFLPLKLDAAPEPENRPKLKKEAKVVVPPFAKKATEKEKLKN
jgi:histidinol phosphatase-like enzyme